MEDSIVPLHFKTRADWRDWLQENYDKKSEVWFVFPLKASGEASILYNDAIEEALCFGWIDSVIRSLDGKHKIQRFTPRKPKSTYSQANKERLRRLAAEDLIHPTFREAVAQILSEEFVCPEDILEAVKKDGAAWSCFQRFSDSYRRIRIAYIEAARKRPDEFNKRLNNFIEKTGKGRIISGYGGINKYY